MRLKLTLFDTGLLAFLMKITGDPDVLSFAIVGCKTQENATLTGQERQGYVQLKVSQLCFVIF